MQCHRSLPASREIRCGHGELVGYQVVLDERVVPDRRVVVGGDHVDSERLDALAQCLDQADDDEQVTAELDARYFAEERP